MAPSLVRLYEQMSKPKYVIAMGACTITRGCPPKSEAVIDALTKLRKKTSREIYEDRIRSLQGNRCFTINHKFYIGRSTHTRNYDRGLLDRPPSTSTLEIPLEIFFKYNNSSVSSPELVN
ncbi:hypothetical protein SO802_007877 [Lithocarpus litseifolius]|uniref:NADH:ubiquinone oxidoreductase-like 20kDa subunit domain-containing protein n=1 Tax=Lithocarpus litseifolius TaxID=425828 RepID=A0AAW2DRJ0_9ROSI